jgi:hypothetical protein
MPTPRRVVLGSLEELLVLLSLLSLTVLPSVSTASFSVVTGAAGRVVDEEEVCVASLVSDVEVAFCEALVGVEDDDDDGGGLDVTSEAF